MKQTWDHSSTETVEDQRLRLVRVFRLLRLEDLPNSHRDPSEDEIRTILDPWRPQRWRLAANKIQVREEQPVWLRTYYDSDDKKIAEWLALEEEGDPNFEEDDGWWRILDDPDVFNFGVNWKRVFDVMTELLSGHLRRLSDPGGELLTQYRRQLRGVVGSAMDDTLEERVSRAQFSVPASMLQSLKASEGTPLVVADGEAWQTDKLRLLWLDWCGNPIRRSEIEPIDLWEVKDAWWGFKFLNQRHWRDRENDNRVGAPPEPGSYLCEKYYAKGEVGKDLYAVDDLLQ
ncbi:hypothetical protein OQA88_5443 [Cercophora sp. LCS_1]